MKPGRWFEAYVLTTGVLFGVLTLAHVWRMVEERQMATEPWYLVITAATAVLSIWAWRLVRRTERPS